MQTANVKIADARTAFHLSGSALPTTGPSCPGNNYGTGMLAANPVPHTETVNALRVHFRDWVMKSVEPPESRWPKLADGTLLASTTWAKENFAPAGQPSFRAFFAFYPYCNTIFPERDRVSAPVRIHTGAADDWTPAKPCADLAGSLKAAGQDVSISVYPDAYHKFDQARDTVFLPNVVNPADCYVKMPSILGPLAPESIANCVKKGATEGNSPSATEQARKNLRAQMEELLR